MHQLGRAWEEERRELAECLAAALRQSSPEPERREVCLELLGHLRVSDQQSDGMRRPVAHGMR